MNTNAKHTAGPWTAELNCIQGPSDEYIATVCASNRRMKADAALIASAPAMLEALKSLIEWESIMGGFDSERWTEARNAIAKATGE